MFRQKLLVLCWIRTVRVDTIVLCLTGIVFSFLPIHYDVGSGFVMQSIYYVDVWSSVTNLFRALITKLLIWLKCFFSPIEIIIWFLYFILFMWYIAFIDLHMLNHPCIPKMQPTWSCMFPLICFEFDLLIFHCRFLHLCSSQI
jgi:hypothetical protein